MLSASQDFFENHLYPVLVVDPVSQRVLYANLAAQNFFQRSKEELLLERFTDLMQAHGHAIDLDGGEDTAHRDVQISDAIFEDKAAKITTLYMTHKGMPDDKQSSNSRATALNLKLEETLEGISDSFIIINRQWEVTFANASAATLMDMPRTQMVGQNVWALFPDGKGGEFHKRYEQLMATGQTQRFTAQSPVSGKWLSVSAYATSQGLVISARDVTDEYARENQLRLLETAVSRLNDIVLITDATPAKGSKWEKFVFANEAFERIIGYPVHDVIGKTAEFLRGPDTQLDVLEKIRVAVDNEMPLRCEIINYTRSGQQLWLDLDVVPLRNDAGVVTHWVSVARDITSKKQSEQLLRLSEERFRLIASASNDVIWDCDLKSDDMWWNDKLLKVFGHDSAAFSNKMDWWDANLHPEEQHDVLQRMVAIIDGPDELWELRYRFQRADGSYADVLDRGSVLRDEGGAAARVLGSMTDITERLHLEEQLRQAQKMEAIGELTGGVAHDFNNLLAIIMGNLELLKEEMLINNGPPQDAYDLIDAGVLAAKRGSDLTGHMLAYARKARLAPVETDLNVVIRETESWVRRTIDSSIEIKTDLDRCLWTSRLDSSLLQSAIVNLLLNARDALGEGGRITITTQNVSASDPCVTENGLPASPFGFVMLRISDTGTGISPRDIEKVFDPFFTTKPVGKGSGLGLSMVHGFVSQSGGAIRISSPRGCGTTIDLYFKADQPAPRKEPEPFLQPDGIPNSGQPQKRRGRILFVEDEPAVLQVFGRMLTNAGYEIVPARSGDTALEIFKRDQNFDLVLTDVSMPGNLNGFDLARACLEIRENMPVVLLSGHADMKVPSGDQDVSGILRLMKPISQNNLLEAIKEQIQCKTDVSGVRPHH